MNESNNEEEQILPLETHLQEEDGPEPAHNSNILMETVSVTESQVVNRGYVGRLLACWSELSLSEISGSFGDLGTFSKYTRPEYEFASLVSLGTIHLLFSALLLLIS